MFGCPFCTVSYVQYNSTIVYLGIIIKRFEPRNKNHWSEGRTCCRRRVSSSRCGSVPIRINRNICAPCIKKLLIFSRCVDRHLGRQPTNNNQPTNNIQEANLQRFPHPIRRYHILCCTDLLPPPLRLSFFVQVLDRMKQDSRLCQVPVVILSGLEDKRLGKTANSIGGGGGEVVLCLLVVWCLR